MPWRYSKPNKQCDCVENTLHRAKTCIHHKKRVHKVHFNAVGEEDAFSDHSTVTVQKISENKLSVHLGFLKLRHRYEVRFRVTKHIASVLQSAIPFPNLHAKFLGVGACEGLDCEVKLEIFASKEKLMKEVLIFHDPSTQTHVLAVILNARVLGHGKGTPSLKCGIRCLGMEPDEDSEASDWQGFD